MAEWRTPRRGASDQKVSGRTLAFFRALERPGVLTALLTAVVVAVLAQSGLIASLLFNRAYRKRSERALLASEERYRNVIESRPDMVCRFLADTTLTFVNEAYCRFLGRPREELLGRRFVELIPPEWHAQVQQTVSVLVNKHEVVNEEHEVFLPDGSVVWHHWENYPIVNQAGEIEEYQGIGQDITDRKRMEELTRNLTQSSRLTLLGELTASIGHEINQPLGAILANADCLELLLGENPLPLEEIRKVTADIRRDDLRAHEIIRGVRALLSKRESKKSFVSLNEIASEIVQLSASEGRKRNVVIKTDFAPGIAPLLGDRVQLQQLLLNFLLNGMEAMGETPTSQREIVVRTALVGTSFVELSVSDAGHGIPEKRLHRVFDSFFTTKKEGMGLGLAITRSIAEAHGGSVSAENNAGAGATFRFRLPIGGQQGPTAVPESANKAESQGS
jgi:PAS domain S-box-containing protein